MAQFFYLCDKKQNKIDFENAYFFTKNQIRFWSSALPV